MQPDSSSKLRQPRRTWIPYFVLIITLLLTGIATYYVEATTRTQAQLRFESAVQRTQDNIQNRLETYIALLQSASGLFAASEQVTRDDFRAYVERLELRRRYPGIQGIGFTLKVSSAETAALAELRTAGVKIAIRPPNVRSEYHAIIYLEPLDQRNQAAIGFDMFTETVRRAAMERARDTGVAAASGKVRLLQEIDSHKQAGFLIYFPVYRNNANLNTVAQRRAALRGFVYSPFRADDLLQGIVGNDDDAVDFDVYDGGEIRPESLLHRSPRRTSNSVARSFTTTRTFEIAGRTWSIVFTSRPVPNSEDSLVTYIVLGGALISLVLFGLTRSQARAKTAAEKAVAQMHKSQAALQASESRLRRLVESNIIGIITADLNGQIFEANHAFLQMVGYNEDELRAGKICWNTLTPPEYQHLDVQVSQELKASGTCSAYEKEYLHKDGSRIPVLLGGAILEGSHLCIAFVLDLTERKRLEVALRQQTIELAQANRLKDDFLAVVSHELRTPLNAMLGWVQLLRSRRLNEEKTTKALEVIERNAKAQTQLIEDLLDVSRLIRGDLRLQMRSVDLVHVIEAAVQTMQPAAEVKRIQLTSAIASSKIGLIWGDPDRLQQIIWNLLSNAVKFTPDGGKVTVTLDRSDQAIAIQVCDTGVGISPEFLPYVFDRFRQAESATTRSSSGLGLGLAIVRQLVELHGGTVRAASPGYAQGATFTVELPLRASGDE